MNDFIELYLPKVPGALLIDLEDWDTIRNNKWRYDKSVLRTTITGKALSRLITKAKKNEIVDHKNHNKLDNRKENLRICNSTANNHNRLKGEFYNGKKTTSKYKGVHFHKRHKKWIAAITLNYKYIHLGSFDSETGAAEAYNEAAILHHKNFACLNII